MISYINYEVAPHLAMPTGTDGGPGVGVVPGIPLNGMATSGVNTILSSAFSISSHNLLVSALAWGYSAPPVAAAVLRVFLTIAAVEYTMLELPVTQDGPNTFYFRPAVIFRDPAKTALSTVTFRLSAGGAGISSYLNILGISYAAPAQG